MTSLAAALASLLLLGATCEPTPEPRVHVALGDSISASRYNLLPATTCCQSERFALFGRGCRGQINAMPYIAGLLAELPEDGTVWLSCGTVDVALGVTEEATAARWDELVRQILDIKPGWNVVTLRYLEDCRVEIWDYVTMTADERVKVLDPWWLGETSDGCHPTEESQYERTTWALVQSGSEVCW